MIYKLSKRSLRRLRNVEPILIAIICDSISDSPFDFGIPRDGGKRTAERQRELFLKGNSTRDGYDRRSYHQSGRAFDIFAYVNGKASWKKHHMEPIARHIQKVAKEKYGVTIQWGGDWKRFVDMPHLQINKNQI